MSKNSILFLVLSLFFVSALRAQQQFTVTIQPSSITAVVPTHSGAFADWNGKWIFIGGRLDGLHIMQANSAFPTSKSNDSVYIVDPVLNTYMAGDVSTLAPDLFQAVTSSNMQYYREGDYLYMIGGYGRQTLNSLWQTFPSLISVDLNCLSNAISSGTSINSCFRQIIDTNLAVAGGMLQKLDSTYYLVFGQRFDGMYMDPQGGPPTFTQVYTEQIRKFNIHDNGVNLSIANYTTITDTDNFHRRDFNLQPQIFPNGDVGMTAFGGVFQKNVELPYLTPIDITSTYIQHQSTFNQNLEQYTSACMPLYDSLNNYMHTVFFGGISLFTLDTTTHTLIEDTLVPFVNTISKISRDGSGLLTEYKLPVEMPALVGSNALFIPDPSVSLTTNGIIRLNSLSGNTRVGFIVGGIQSDHPNVGDLDPEGMSRPNAQVYEVYVNRNVNSVLELQIRNGINNLQVYPNPAKNKLFIDFSLKGESKFEITIYSIKGQLVRSIIQEKKSGDQHLVIDLEGVNPGNYLCKVKAGDSAKVMRVVIEK